MQYVRLQLRNNILSDGDTPQQRFFLPREKERESESRTNDTFLDSN